MEKQLLNLIKEKVSKNKDEVISMRRWLHQHPELSFNEYNTANFIEQKLNEFGVNEYQRMVNTGIVAIVKGKNPDKKIIALRADIDALPILEENNTPYCSKNNGIMHACGHDAHTASLLGVIKITNEIKDYFEGTIKFIFQPGEEKLPGGASMMIEQGVLENPTPKIVIGQHVFPELDAGKVGFKSGMYMASTDELYLTVHGKGGHAALPDKYINPILIASKILIALNDEFMAKSDSLKNNIPTVLAFGKMNAEGATNVIPSKAEIEGTFRTMDEKWRGEAHEKMIQIAKKISNEMGGDCNFEIKKGYPFLVNDVELTQRAVMNAKEYLGNENVVELDVRMTAEDFSFYSQQKPSCFYRFGVTSHSAANYQGLHTSKFDIDESSLETSVGVMLWIALNELMLTS